MTARLPALVGSLTTALADTVTGAAQQVLPPVPGLVDELLTPLLPALPGLPGLPALPGLPGLPALPGLPGLPALPGLPGLPADPAGPPGPATPPAGPAPSPGAPVEPGAPPSPIPAPVPATPSPGPVGGVASGPTVASVSLTGWTAGPAFPGAARAASGQVGTVAEAQPSGGPGRSGPAPERADDARATSGPVPASADEARWSSYAGGRERTTRSSVPVDGRAPAVTVRPG
ncbi:hypothetical protein [Micromonospora sp. NPDC001898]|uniref:hypothetical protein n=1 Tax=Micromonospora sp. NPDC001898 TaxID=3364221 RepID=UPI00368FAFA4